MEYIAGETVSSLLGRSSSASSLTRLTISRLDSIHPRHLTSPRLTMNSTFIHCIEDIRRRRGEKRAAVCRQNIRRWMKGESRGFSFISPPPFSLSLSFLVILSASTSLHYPLFSLNVRNPRRSVFCSPRLFLFSSARVCPDELPVSDTRLLFNYYSSSLFSLTFLRINDDLLDCNPWKESEREAACVETPCRLLPSSMELQYPRPRRKSRESFDKGKVKKTSSTTMNLKEGRRKGSLRGLSPES